MTATTHLNNRIRPMSGLYGFSYAFFKLSTSLSASHLAGLELGQARERQPHLHPEVIADAFPELEGAVVPPHGSRLLRHAAVGRDVLLWDGNDKSVDVSYVNPPYVVELLSKAWRD